MISCTEFIPLYSELFKFLEKTGGYDAVVDYWHFIAKEGVCNKENTNSLISYLERDKDDPIEGAWKYWKMTLTEEACDLFRIYDRKRKIIYSHMRHCPSKGMLDSLAHIEPYCKYCEHCNVIYPPALNQYGLFSHRDNTLVDNAECKSIIFVEGNDPGIDLATVRDEDFLGDDVEIMDMKADDNKYLHRDFHFHGDLALRYLGRHFGDNGIRAFLTDYVKNFYSPEIEDTKKRGLVAIKDWLERIYRIEEASELISFRQSDDELLVTIEKSPAIAHLRSTNYEPSKYYIEQTRTLYSAFADSVGLGFTLDYYDEDGKAEFRFFKRKYNQGENND